ncbi:MAG: EamA family transporter [Firmicutes bacterium]|nr:EamA family transporter [Bacillota bacterium]
MKSKNLAALGPFIVMLAATLWGSVGIFTKYLYSVGFTPFQASMLRCSVAAVIIVPIMLIAARNQLKLRSWKDLLFFVISGTFGLALCYTSYFITIQQSTLSIAAVMLYSSPIMVTIMAAVLFKEKITVPKAVSIILAFTGCIVMSGILGGAGISLTITGLLIGFLSGFGYALYNIGSRMALKHYSTYAVTTYTFIFATLGMLPFTPLKKTVTMLAADPLSIGAALGLGILATLIPYTLYVLALNYVEVSKASVLAIIEPVAATIIGLIAFNEALTFNTVVAMVIILCSVLVANIKSKKTVSISIVEQPAEIETESWMAEKQISEKMAERREAKENAEAAFSGLDK